MAVYPHRITAVFLSWRSVAGSDAIIESVRTEGEVTALRGTGKPFVLLAVDADQKTRYERVTGRGSSTDGVSFEKFCKQANQLILVHPPDLWFVIVSTS
eukprot:SAG31_NODE_4007_length_3670_cov_1.628955_6_plen_99_part_00